MGQGPGRVCAASGNQTGTRQAQTETKQGRAGENRGRFEETVGRQEGRRVESQARRQKENCCQKGGGEEGGARRVGGEPGSRGLGSELPPTAADSAIELHEAQCFALLSLNQIQLR